MGWTLLKSLFWALVCATAVTLLAKVIWTVYQAI